MYNKVIVDTMVALLIPAVAYFFYGLLPAILTALIALLFIIFVIKRDIAVIKSKIFEAPGFGSSVFFRQNTN